MSTPSTGGAGRHLASEWGSPRRRGFRRRAGAASVVVLSLVSLTACGEDSSDGNGSSDDSVYRLMTIGPLTASAALPTPFAEIATGAEAAAKAINEKGGVNGRQISVEACDSKGDPNTATQCALKAVKEGYVAVVGSFDLKGDYISVLERAGIPVLAPFARGVELSNPAAYPVNGGTVTLLAGEISLLASKGARDVQFVAAGTAADGAGLAGLWGPVLPNFDGLSADLIPLPPDAIDLAAIAEKAAQGDAVGIGLQAAQFVPFITALRQSGDVKYIACDTNSLDQSVAEALGPSADGILAPSSVLPSTTEGNDAVDAYNAAMNAVDPAALKNDFSTAAYLGVNLFAQAADGLSEVTPKALKERLDSGEIFDLGLVPPISFDKPSTVIDGVTRLFNTSVVYTEFKDGAFHPIDGTFVDAYTGQPVS